MPMFRIMETSEHHSVYEVEADSKDDALAILRSNFEDKLVEEFWGETLRDIEEIRSSLEAGEPA